MNTNIFVSKQDLFLNDKYIVVKYELSSKRFSLEDVLGFICWGQSIGNITIRNEWETPEMLDNHGCKAHVEDNVSLKTIDFKNSVAYVGFPCVNFNLESDGISQILCSIMGGQVDVDGIDKCRILSVHFPNSFKVLEPKFGISGLRKYTGVYNKPLLGGIIKPKIGMSPQRLLDQVKEMVDNGINWIKEDEIMGDPDCCPILDRSELVMNYIRSQKNPVLYHVNVNGDHKVPEKVQNLFAWTGINGIHLNIWCGFGTYREVRKLDLPISIHLQKSMDKVFTHKDNPYSISWPAVCTISSLLGIDSIHCGMVGGYSNDDPMEMSVCMDILRTNNIMPALSCGLGPHNVQEVTNIAGVDYLGNSGGCIQGHPKGTSAGTKAMRQAIDGNHGEEYQQAIQKWGKAPIADTYLGEDGA